MARARRKRRGDGGHENHERWLVSYADYMTLLFALFVVLYAFAMTKETTTRAMIQGLIDSFGQIGFIAKPRGSPVLDGGTGIIDHAVGTKELAQAAPSVIESLPRSLATSKVLESDRDSASEAIPLPESSSSTDDAKSQQAMGQLTEIEHQQLVKNLQTEFQQQIKDGSMQIESLGQQVIIRLNESASFAAESAYLQPKFEPLVLKIASILKDVPGQIKVTGHTDSTPPPSELFRSNWDLSAQRAASVALGMLDEKGMSPNRIVVQGVADTQPLVPNDTDQHRKENRRVEIALTQGKPTVYSAAALKQ
ncbi:MAG TPA: flagellar motor protein MotB [Plesiomonas shigelloides]|nr:flagellar motor protein MotB [Plesiomonas shigelloides]